MEERKEEKGTPAFSKFSGPSSFKLSPPCVHLDDFLLPPTPPATSKSTAGPGLRLDLAEADLAGGQAWGGGWSLTPGLCEGSRLGRLNHGPILIHGLLRGFFV